MLGSRKGLTFVSGHPGDASRGKTMAQIDDERDFRLLRNMNFASEMHGYLTAYQYRGSERKRRSADSLFGFENWLKSMKGQHQALADPAFCAQLAARERSLRDEVAARPEWQREHGPVWGRIAELVRHGQGLREEFVALEIGDDVRDVSHRLPVGALWR